MGEEIGKKSTLLGVIWKFSERICAQMVSLMVAVILARILTPDDYSVVGIVTVFFTFCNIFISGGLNSALIQKKNTDVLDFSSVLWASIGVSAILYVIMFFLSPYIAKIYGKPILTEIIRVMAITFFINAIKSVLCAYISRSLQFKKFFFATLGGTVISAIIGIIMALNGFGAWSLVAQQMSNCFIDTVILWIITKVKFVCKISFKRVKVLFSYGWKIFAGSALTVFYDNVKPMIVGLKFAPVDLAYYTKGRSFPQLLNSTICDTITAVLFPVISKVQDNKSMVSHMTRKFMQIGSYVVFPLLMGFSAVSESFIKILLTEKWNNSVVYVQIFCLSYMFYIMQVGNLQAIRAIGRSDITLKLDIVKRVVSFVMIFLFVIFFDNPYALAVSDILCGMVSFAINSMPNKMLLGYGTKEQVLDVLPNLICAVVMGLCVQMMNGIKISPFLLIIVQMGTGIGIYLLLSLIFLKDNLKCIYKMLKNLVK